MATGLVERLKEDYLSGAARIRETHFGGAGGTAVVRAFTEHTDGFIRAAFFKVCEDLGLSKKSPGWALAAVGGYGRGELNPYSDIDIMFLGEKAAEAGEGTLPKAALHLLWDLGFNLGYSVRTPDDCLALIKTDFTIMTSLLEARHLAGDRKVYDLFREKIRGYRNPRAVEEYVREKLLERAVRHKKYGDSVYLREPNVKEGAGGLRDIHAALWIARVKYGVESLDEMKGKGMIGDGDLRRLKGSRDYMLRLRNELHYVSGHRQDVLTFDLQEAAAADFGYRPRPGRMAVENFMRAYFLRARGIHEVTHGITERALDKRPGRKWFVFPPSRRAINERFYAVDRSLCLSGEAKEVFLGAPESVVEAFSLAQGQGLTLSDNLKAAIRERIGATGKALRESGAAAGHFLEILGRVDGVHETLGMMHGMGVLGRLLPEFGAVTGLVQHDLYHRYTVDEHSLIATRKVQELLGAPGLAYPEFGEALLRVGDRQALMLAVLLHDCGKAKGKGHSEHGALAARGAALRLGMDERRAERVEFLIRNHLLMAQISQRRELTDLKVIERFCRIVDDPEALDMLYVLTYADMCAVGPEMFNDWKMMLLKELHGRARDYLKHEVTALAGERERLAATRDRIVREAVAKKAASSVEINAFLDNLPANYLLSLPVETVLRHYRLTRGIKGADVVIDHEHDPRGYTNLTIILHDFMGVLYISAGALASRNMNIISAQIFTGKDGIIVDTLQVTDYNKKPAADAKLWEEIKVTIKKLLRGQARAEDIMPQRPAYPRRTALRDVPVRVEVDNDVSDRYTVIEVYSADRVGLLFDITRELYRLGCYISSAKVDTDVDQVVDVFYVTDIFRQKIEDRDRMTAIKGSIAAAVSGENN